MRIQNNIMAMNTHRMYTTNNNNVAKSAEKLSSGYRINRAGDDAAGLAISEKMRAQIRGLNMASKNSQDAVSLVQTAEGALQEVHSMLQRMNELAVQAASDTNDTGVDRAALQQEFSNLQDEIDQIASTTKFNNMALLNGKVDADGNPVVGGAVTVGNTTTGTPNTAGTITFAVQADGTVKASIDGTENVGAVTVNGVDLTDPDETVVNAGAVTVAFDGVTTTLTVGAEGSTVGDIKEIINGLTYGVTQGASTTSYAATQNTGFGMGANFDATGLDITGYLDANATAAAEHSAVTMTDGVMTINGSTITGTLSGTGTGAADAFQAGDTITLTLAGVGTIDYTLQAGDAAIIGQTDLTGATATAAMALFDHGTAGDYAIAANTTPGAMTVSTAPTSAGAGNNPASWVIQVGAEEGQTLDVKINAMNTTGLAITKATNANNATAINNTAGGAVSIHNRESASHAISRTRTAINTVSTQRAELGAMQNRLEHKIANLDNTAENLSSAESRIRDVDIAKEMTNFTKNNILAQASTAMLAQANAAPQGVLSLLQ